MRERVLLYNPLSEFYAMPLGLAAVGSALDPERYDVRIFDERIERGAGERLFRSAPGARAVGLTVFSGPPIGPALRLSERLKETCPEVPVVWGGWHPSILPEQCVASGAVDAVVIGQGEATFRDLVDQADARQSWSSLPGLCVSTENGPRRTPPRPMVDMNTLPPVRYDPLNVEAYFAHKGARQLDYSSSRGCPYKCTFCADPLVYQSRWTSLSARRTASELAALHARYGFDEVFLLDDDLFASLKRIRALVDAFIDRRAGFGWKGTARADELCRLPGDFFPRLRDSGCRRVNIGAESGSQRVLDSIRKQYRVDQIVEAARRLAAAGVGAAYSFITGFPGETAADFQATLDVIKAVRGLSPKLECTLFFYSPYPGTALFGELESGGVDLPRKLEEWETFSIDVPWLSDARDRSRRVSDLNFYVRHAYSAGSRSPVRRALKAVSRVRCERDWYGLPVEPYLARLLRAHA